VLSTWRKKEGENKGSMNKENACERKELDKAVRGVCRLVKTYSEFSFRALILL
jgi:hypothetical protein